MRFIAPWLIALLMAGCMVTSEREGLPTGATLLGSTESSCDGPLEVEGDVVVEEGESTTVAAEDEDVEWRCIAGDQAEADDFECPDGTDYVRVSRNQGESDFTLECFG